MLEDPVATTIRITLPGPHPGNYDEAVSLSIIELGSRAALNVDSFMTIVTRADLAVMLSHYGSPAWTFNDTS